MPPSIAAPITTSEIDYTTYPVPEYRRPDQTKDELDYAPLVEIDISRFYEPGEKERLAAQLDDAVRNVGFWIVTGHGIKDEEVVRMLALGNAFFNLPMEEKVKVRNDFANNLNWGYREPVRFMGPTGLKECTESVSLLVTPR
jgi:hypothetical protein